jgi:4-hydroxybenzoate polyprenyltransferase
LKALLHNDTVRLLRIPFSLYLMPVFLLALSQAERIDPLSALLSFLIIHVLVYPSSNGYNSYVDRDEGSIGGLEHPPLPTKALYQVTLVLDLIAILLAAITVNLLFALCICAYVLASRAYSSPKVRLKRRAWGGFFTVVFFQGAFTYYMSLIGISGGEVPAFNPALACVLLASSAQIAGAYPLTQIYQHSEDRKRGDISLSLLLGYRGTFLFSGAMFLLSAVFYAMYFGFLNKASYFFILLFFLLPIIAYFTRWYLGVLRNSENAGYRQTMRMNRIASISMSACFIFFILTRLFL